MKNLIVTYKDAESKRGSYFLANRLSKNYPDIFDYIEHTDLNKKNYRELYNKLIFNYQQPMVYDHSVCDFKSLYHNQDVIFIRDEYSNLLYNSFSNGFYYWKNSKHIKSYIPMLTFDDSFINNNKNYDNKLIGVYVSVAYTDEQKYIINIIKRNPEINFIILGSNFAQGYKNVNSTFDNKYFFNNITHYLYIPSHLFPSPFPNTLLEAVLSNCIIMILGLEDRNIQDGVLDIIENINYLDTFDLDKFIENKNTILHPNNLNNYYKNNLLDFNGFQDKNKYKSFTQLLESII
jgi:hypothetical protein